jgi:hypothetical protein
MVSIFVAVATNQNDSHENVISRQILVFPIVEDMLALLL